MDSPASTLGKRRRGDASTFSAGNGVAAPSRKKRPAAAPLSSEQREAMTDLYDIVLSVRTRGKRTAEAFMELPDRYVWEDYYQYIPNPICLDEIRDSLSNRKYQSAGVFVEEMELVFLNAMHYNESGSQIYKNARLLLDIFHDEYKKRVAEGVLPPVEYTTAPPPPEEPQAPAPPSHPSTPKAVSPIPLPTTAGSPKPGSVTHPTPASPGRRRARPKKPSATSQSPLPPPSQPLHSPASAPDVALPSSSAPPYGNVAGAGQATVAPMQTTQSLVTLTSSFGGPATRSSQPAAQEQQRPYYPTPIHPSTFSAPTYSAPPPQAWSQTVFPVAPTSQEVPGAPHAGAVPGAEQYGSARSVEHANGSGEGRRRGSLKVPDEGDRGWMAVGPGKEERRKRYLDILTSLREFRDRSGRALSGPLESLPEEDEDPEYFERIEKPTSLEVIEKRARNDEYPAVADFEMDMMLLFANARTLFEPGTQEYGDSLVLQRLYQQLTKSHSAAEDAGSPSAISSAVEEPFKQQRGVRRRSTASANFSSMSAGPGHATSEHGLHTRITSKSKEFWEALWLKGRKYTVGDWVHLMNPDDPSRPIIAQIFKAYKRQSSPQGWITVCWYYRPEQTVHPPERTFFENEIFKTGNFADHQLEDIMEKVFVQFYTKYIRGRPSREVWDPKSPLYVCADRYNVQHKVFNPIKNWNSCLPEECRKVEYPLDTFEKQITNLKRISSPFLRGIEGPGYLGHPESAKDEHKFVDLFEASERPVGKKAKKRKLGEGVSPTVAGMAPSLQGPRQEQTMPPLSSFGGANIQQLLVNARAAGFDLSQLLGPNGQLNQDGLRALAASAAFSQSSAAPPMATLQGPFSPTPAQPSFAALPVSSVQAQTQGQSPVTKVALSGSAEGNDEDAEGEDEGALQTSGALATAVARQGGEGVFEMVPRTTQRRFATDPSTNQLLWFPSPPSEPPAPPQQPRHSFTYLSRQTMAEQSAGGSNSNGTPGGEGVGAAAVAIQHTAQQQDTMMPMSAPAFGDLWTTTTPPPSGIGTGGDTSGVALGGALSAGLNGELANWQSERSADWTNPLSAGSFFV